MKFVRKTADIWFDILKFLNGNDLSQISSACKHVSKFIEKVKTHLARRTILGISEICIEKGTIRMTNNGGGEKNGRLILNYGQEIVKDLALFNFEHYQFELLLLTQTTNNGKIKR